MVWALDEAVTPIRNSSDFRVFQNNRGHPWPCAITFLTLWCALDGEAAAQQMFLLREVVRWEPSLLHLGHICDADRSFSSGEPGTGSVLLAREKRLLTSHKSPPTSRQ